MKDVNKLLTYAVILRRFTHIRVRTVRDNAYKITGSAESGTEVFVQQFCRSLIGMNRTKNYACESLTVLLHIK